MWDYASYRPDVSFFKRTSLTPDVAIRVEARAASVTETRVRGELMRAFRANPQLLGERSQEFHKVVGFDPDSTKKWKRFLG
jgi:hypothetical protein